MPLFDTLTSWMSILGGAPRLPARTAIAWCPRCRRDLNGDDESFAGDKEVVHYRCATCGCLSWWDFEAECPILLGSSHAPTVPVIARRKTANDEASTPTL